MSSFDCVAELVELGVAGAEWTPVRRGICAAQVMSFSASRTGYRICKSLLGDYGEYREHLFEELQQPT